MICESYKSFMNNVRLKILFFASWYPNKYDNVLGVFVRNKAQAVVSRFVILQLFMLLKDPCAENIFDIDYAYEENVLTVRVYFRIPRNPIIQAIIYNIRFSACVLFSLENCQTTAGEHRT